eukprot:CAMPEP_0119145962 /NCGR_PEP_ID=MMETSP1310-20130426/38233_1 /TAXON_ID=464262 /ORGANISM="Genus nov. species nov., Strain RCC2339" /LENGTH=72 /DNA_ID=CAMNT_0007137817 /DNA_START=222 /DNA_END=436 /DNA_ORIENTATION=+
MTSTHSGLGLFTTTRRSPIWTLTSVASSALKSYSTSAMAFLGRAGGAARGTAGPMADFCANLSSTVVAGALG